MPIEFVGRTAPTLDNNQGKVDAPARTHSDTALSDSAKPLSGNSDTVHITPMAEKLQNLEKSLAQIPVVNAQHVARIQNALASNQYATDPQRVAEKLVDFERNLAQALR